MNSSPFTEGTVSDHQLLGRVLSHSHRIQGSHHPSQSCTLRSLSLPPCRQVMLGARASGGPVGKGQWQALEGTPLQGIVSRGCKCHWATGRAMCPPGRSSSARSWSHPRAPLPATSKAQTGSHKRYNGSRERRMLGRSCGDRGHQLTWS